MAMGAGNGGGGAHEDGPVHCRYTNGINGINGSSHHLNHLNGHQDHQHHQHQHHNQSEDNSPDDGDSKQPMSVSDVDHSPLFLQGLSKLRRNRQFCDVVLQVRDTQVASYFL